MLFKWYMVTNLSILKFGTIYRNINNVKLVISPILKVQYIITRYTETYDTVAVRNSFIPIFYYGIRHSIFDTIHRSDSALVLVATKIMVLYSNI